MARMRASISGSVHQLDAHHLGDHVAGDVVLGRAQAAAHDAPRRCAPGRPRRRGRRSAPGCRPPSPGSRSRCRPGPAARRSTTSWCRRSGRAAARCRRPRPHSACRCAHSTGVGAAAGDDPVRRAWRAGRAGTAPPLTTATTTDAHSRVSATHWWAMASGGMTAAPTARPCRSGLELAAPRGGHGQAPAPPVDPVEADAHLAHGDDDHRHPGEPADRRPTSRGPRAPAPCRPADPGRHPTGWCRGGGRSSRRRRRCRPARSRARTPSTTSAGR